MCVFLGALGWSLALQGQPHHRGDEEHHAATNGEGSQSGGEIVVPGAVLADPEGAHQANSPSEEDQPANYEPFNYDAQLVLIGWAGVLLAALGVVLLFVTWRATVAVNETTREIGVVQSRAYVDLESVRLVRNDKETVKTSIEIAGRTLYVWLEFKLTNPGATPAVAGELQMAFDQIGEIGPPETEKKRLRGSDKRFSVRPQGDTTIRHLMGFEVQPDGSLTVGLGATARPEGQRTGLYLKGRIAYTDYVKVRREFWWSVQFSSRALRLDADSGVLMPNERLKDWRELTFVEKTEEREIPSE